MGTNYYLEVVHACPTCGHKPESLHIGKSSAGWCFALHVIPEAGINSLADWQARWSAPNTRIVDEYREVVTPEQMLTRITQRVGHGALDGEWYTRNHAVAGPNNLARSRIDGSHCVGHGDATYDLCTGDFS